MKRFLIILTCLILVTMIGSAQTAKPSDDEAAVRTVVQSYLHGLKFNDVESLKKAFWPDAKLFWVKPNGQLGQLTQEEWYKGFAGSAGKEEKGELKITAIDITDNAASVKVHEDYPTSNYIDYLSLLKFNGEWRIVNKIYTSQRKKA